MGKPLIVCVNGSPRKNGNTVKLLRMVEDGVRKAGGETTFVHLIDKNIKPCLGCYSTKPQSCTYPCKQKDDMKEIYKFIIKANGIVLGSPSYWFNVSGLMKNFIDRLLSLENNDLIENKVAGFVATAEETGGEEVVDYMIDVMNEMGFAIPPFATSVYTTKKSDKKDMKYAEILGENMIKLIESLKKTKFKLPP